MYEEILPKLTLEQKIRFCTGADQWSTEVFPGIIDERFSVSDGPHGLRKEIFKDGKKECTVPATAFATASCLAGSWDRELAAEVAAAMGRETLAAGVQILLGCGVNIKRNPLCGRNMEYISEDPVLSGELGAAWLQGLESTGAGGSLKHFCCNNKEIHRNEQDAVVDERALREIYLKPFEIAVKKANPATVMTSYNMLNGDYTGEKESLVNGILREEWGYDGVVVSDWDAVKDQAKSLEAGEDLRMPRPREDFVPKVLDAVKNGRLSEEKIDLACKRLLALLDRVCSVEMPMVHLSEHHTLARREAEESAVLLKNENGVLPLRAGATVCVIGEFAKNHPVGGGGSSAVTPSKVESLCDGLDAEGVPYRWFGGTEKKGGELDEAALRAAQSADMTILVLGSANGEESEGIDRVHMTLSPGQVALAQAVAQHAKSVVLVLTCGAPVELPFADDIDAIMLLGLSGQAGGSACARLLTGEVNPCGKLTESWPQSYQDVPYGENFSQEMYRVHYAESIFVGYRYYQTADVPVRWSFGHGLSYTRFTYSGLAVVPAGDAYAVTATITNTGTVAGKEVVQLYVGKPRDHVPNPARELVDFTKVALAPGQSTEVRFLLQKEQLAVYLANEHRWAEQQGAYTVEVGSGSAAPELRASVDIDGEELSVKAPAWYFTPKGSPSKENFLAIYGQDAYQKLPVRVVHSKGTYDRTDCFFNIRSAGTICRIVIGAMVAGAEKTTGAGTAQTLLHTPLATLGDVLGHNLTDGLLLCANGHSLRGLRLMLKKSTDQLYTVADFYPQQ